MSHFYNKLLPALMRICRPRKLRWDRRTRVSVTDRDKVGEVGGGKGVWGEETGVREGRGKDGGSWLEMGGLWLLKNVRGFKDIPTNHPTLMNPRVSVLTK